MLVYGRHAMRSCSCGLGLLVLLMGLSGCGDSSAPPQVDGATVEATKKAMDSLPGLDRIKDMTAKVKKGPPRSSKITHGTK